MADLLLELFSEEIPARMQMRAARDLERLVQDALLEHGFMPEGVKCFATPRRLTLVVAGLLIRQKDVREERKGPRVGAPDKAIAGFLRGAGLESLGACETRSDAKGEYYVAVIEKSGRDTGKIIAELIPDLVRNFPWPKSMRWASGSTKWVRPLRSVLCCFNDEVVPFAIGDIASGDVTYGHRFLAADAISVRGFDAYAKALRGAKVLLDSEERKELIAEEAKTLCQAQGLELVEDKALLDEVAGLVEWPVVLIGQYDEKFLKLPDEVLIASMRGHQKYFSVRNPKTGRLANRFIVVANMETSDGGVAMRQGYERVLTARLSDGWFLYEQDLAVDLQDRIEDLEKITFFAGLGSVGDKSRRVTDLAQKLAPITGADGTVVKQAARLAKADLVSGMVNEFPELQGVMGHNYMMAQSIDNAGANDTQTEDIANAIRDHYKPQGPGDLVPSHPVTMAVALGDKLDILCAFWAIGKKPTGSSDPFALRRAALGVIEIVLKNKLRFNIAKFCMNHLTANKAVIKPNKDGSIPTIEEICADLLSFFHDRLKVYYRDKKHRHDHIDAVLTKINDQIQDDFVLVDNRLHALETFITSDDGSNLVAGYKRAANILKAEAKKTNLPVGQSLAGNLLKEAAEKSLFASLEESEHVAQKAIADENFSEAMGVFSRVRAPLDDFFENVKVNDEDANLRVNRLALLVRFRDATAQIADFSKLEG